ncbi:MAG: hypothetical protein RIT45_3158 [Pseudomonadota bacterium]
MAIHYRVSPLRSLATIALTQILIGCGDGGAGEKATANVAVKCESGSAKLLRSQAIPTACSATDRKNAGALGPLVENEGLWYQGQQWFHYRQGCRSFEARPSEDTSELIVEEFESGEPRIVRREVGRLPLQRRSVKFAPGAGASSYFGMGSYSLPVVIRLSANTVLLPLCRVFGSHDAPSNRFDFVGQQFVVIDHGSDPPALREVSGKGLEFDGICVSAVGVRDGVASALLAIQVHPDTPSAEAAPPSGGTLHGLHVDIVRVERAGTEFVAKRLGVLPPAWKDVRAISRRGQEALLVGYRSKSDDTTVVGPEAKSISLTLKFAALRSSGDLVEIGAGSEGTWQVNALMRCTDPAWFCGYEIGPTFAGSAVGKGSLKLNLRNELRVHARSVQAASAEVGQVNEGHVGFLTRAEQQFPQGFHAWDAVTPPVATADPGKLDAWLEPGCTRTNSYFFQPVTLPSGELLLFAVVRAKPESCSGVFAIRMTHHGSIRWLKRLPLSASTAWGEIRYVPEVDASGFVWWGPTSFLAPFAVTDPVDISACGGLGWDGCSDGNACTMDDCAATTGCTHRPVPDGVPCVDGVPSACLCGVCVVGKSP